MCFAKQNSESNIMYFSITTPLVISTYLHNVIIFSSHAIICLIIIQFPHHITLNTFPLPNHFFPQFPRNPSQCLIKLNHHQLYPSFYCITCEKCIPHKNFHPTPVFFFFSKPYHVIISSHLPSYPRSSHPKHVID